MAIGNLFPAHISLRTVSDEKMLCCEHCKSVQALFDHFRDPEPLSELVNDAMEFSIEHVACQPKVDLAV